MRECAGIAQRARRTNRKPAIFDINHRGAWLNDVDTPHVHN